jgi:hypothetical protein
MELNKRYLTHTNRFVQVALVLAVVVVLLIAVISMVLVMA